MSSVPDVPASSGENGNTNSFSPALKWCFTFNNYSEDDILIIVPMFQKFCKKYIFQKEVGKNGTPHLQGAIWLKVKTRPMSLKLSKKIHWEKMRNEEASIAYCKKSETSIGEPFIFGFPKPLKTLTNLYPWQKNIENVFMTEPDDRSVHWFWESKGNVGKSAFCRYMAITHKVCVIQGGKLSDIMNIIFNLDMDSTKMIIIDIPRNNQNKVSYSSIECIKNGMITNTKYETGFKVFNPPHVVVFSNFPPDQEKLSADRWKIEEIVGTCGNPVTSTAPATVAGCATTGFYYESEISRLVNGRASAPLDF